MLVAAIASSRAFLSSFLLLTLSLFDIVAGNSGVDIFGLKRNFKDQELFTRMVDVHRLQVRVSFDVIWLQVRESCDDICFAKSVTICAQ